MSRGIARALAEVRVEAQTITRNAELANRRLQAIVGERAEWSERKNKAAAQIETIGERTEEATTERAELDQAPEKFATQRQALIGEIETATAGRRAAADRLAEAKPRLPPPTRPRAPPSKRSAKPAPKPPAPKSAATAPPAGAPTSSTKSAIRSTSNRPPPPRSPN